MAAKEIRTWLADSKWGHNWPLDNWVTICHEQHLTEIPTKFQKPKLHTHTNKCTLTHSIHKFIQFFLEILNLVLCFLNNHIYPQVRFFPSLPYSKHSVYQKATKETQNYIGPRIPGIQQHEFRGIHLHILYGKKTERFFSKQLSVATNNQIILSGSGGIS